MKRLVMRIVLATLLLFVLGSSLAFAGPKIGISVVGTEHQWDREAFQGVIDGVKELGGTPIALDGERRDDKQVADIENLIAQKPDAIVVILGTTSVLEPVMKKIHDSNIPLITVDHPSPYSLVNVTSNNYQIGTDLGLKIASDLKGKGKIVLWYGYPGVRVVEIRHNMLVEVLKDYPGIEILTELAEVIPGTVEDARKKIQTLLMQYGPGKVDAIWSAWDMPTVGSALAIDAAGRNKDIKVYGIDGDPMAVELVRDPESSYTATMAQQPRKIGLRAAEAVFQILDGETLPPGIYIEPILVTKENVEEVAPKLGL